MNIATAIALGALAFTVLGTFMAGAFYMGKLAARIDQLEAWRGEVKTSLDAIFTALREVRDLVKGVRV